MIKLGSHVSLTGGLEASVKQALSYGANTFMVYTGAPQNTMRADLSTLKIDEARRLMSQHGITDFVVHAPYIINLASADEEKFKFAYGFFSVELKRTRAFGAKYLVTHPGAYVNSTVEEGAKRIAEGLNKVVKEDAEVTVCLETMAGKGKEIGGRFEELAMIIEHVDRKDLMGVCFDTCHVYDAGYDIVNDFDGVMRDFDNIIGLERLKVVHVNGSIKGLGSRKDRHANIGAGPDNPTGADTIGLEAMRRIVHSGQLAGRLFILETPWLDNKTNLYKEEIALLRQS